jgi:hypothetical protein
MVRFLRGHYRGMHVLTPQQGRLLLTISSKAHLQEYQEVKTVVGIEQARKGYTQLATCGPVRYLTHPHAATLNLFHFTNWSAYTVQDSLSYFASKKVHSVLASEFSRVCHVA